MSVIKTQAEIRYSAILNFREIYKPIISPYLKFAKFQIVNADTLQEYIILNFIEEGITIDIRWDRIIFICEGKKDNLFLSNGPMQHYFEVLEKLTDQPSFGTVVNYILGEWELIEIDKEQSQINQEFKDRYFTSNVLPQTDYDIHDFAMIFEYKEKENQIKLQFGPFRSEMDIENYKLKTPFSKELPGILSKRGILIQIIHSELSKVNDINIFRKMHIKNAKLSKIRKL